MKIDLNEDEEEEDSEDEKGEGEGNVDESLEYSWVLPMIRVLAMSIWKRIW